MRYANLPGINKPVSRLVQGTMWMNRDNLDAAFASLDAFHAAGGNCFDTAHVYAGGLVSGSSVIGFTAGACVMKLSFWTKAHITTRIVSE